MIKYVQMSLIIRDYLKQFEGQSEKVRLTALEARKLPGMDDFAENKSYANVAKAMETVEACYYRGEICNPEKRESSTYALEYDVSKKR